MYWYFLRENWFASLLELNRLSKDANSHMETEQPNSKTGMRAVEGFLLSRVITPRTKTIVNFLTTAWLQAMENGLKKQLKTTAVLANVMNKNLYGLERISVSALWLFPCYLLRLFPCSPTILRTFCQSTYFGPICDTSFSSPKRRNCPGPLSGPTVTRTSRGWKKS